MKNYSVYCFSYNNPGRYERMNSRFHALDISVNWVPAVSHDDHRIEKSDDARTQSIMYGHLDMIRAFLNSPDEYGVFCEDDVHIRRDFTGLMSQAIEAYDRLGLDVMMLGYLTNYKPITYNIHSEHYLISQPLAILSYKDDVWGAQMYMCNRVAAQKILDAFPRSSAMSTPFGADWTITKWGKRALVYPMLAVEEGAIQTESEIQSYFHTMCSHTHYDPAVYL